MNKASTAGCKHIDRRILLKGAAALAATGPAVLRGRFAAAQLPANRATAFFAYVGAFTTPERKGHGGGITVYRVDPVSGGWTQEQLLEIVNPSFLALDRTQRFLYSVHADLDEVSAYAIDKQSGHITALNRQSCGGKNPVHLSIDPTGRWIVTANYSTGSVGLVPIEEDGTLGPRSDLVDLPGEPGPDRKQQANSHPHNAVFDPNGRFVAVPDKGLDRVFVFRLDAANGKLSPNDPPFVATRAGAGPRHIAFHPQVPLAYVINELGSSVTTYRFDPQRGSLQPIQILPSIPANYTGNNTGRNRRGPLRPRRLRLEPRTRQHRDFCRRSARRDADAGGLGTDPREVAPVFRSRSGCQNPLRGQRRRGLQRSAEHRHDRAVRDQSSERNAEADRSGHQDQQPVHDRLCQRVALGSVIARSQPYHGRSFRPKSRTNMPESFIAAERAVRPVLARSGAARTTPQGALTGDGAI